MSRPSLGDPEKGDLKRPRGTFSPYRQKGALGRNGGSSLTNGAGFLPRLKQLKRIKEAREARKKRGLNYRSSEKRRIPGHNPPKQSLPVNSKKPQAGCDPGSFFT